MFGRDDMPAAARIDQSVCAMGATMQKHSLLLLATGLCLASAGAQAALCTTDAVPAASLLVPYFEIGTACGPQNADTRITVFNTGPAPRLAKVTLWTNAAVPIFSFDVYLQGFDQQDIGIGDLYCRGFLPATGPGVSQPGRQAAAEVSFPGCNATSNPANGAPVYAGDGAVPAATLAHVRASLAGGPSPQDGLCHSINDDPDRATGYVTIDSVTTCGAPTAGQAGFAAALSTANTLSGRVDLSDSDQNASVAYAAVPVEDGSASLGSSATFYRLGGVGGDGREPLPTTYGVDLEIVPGAVQQSLLVWRGTGAVGVPFACNGAPAWYPLDFANKTGFGTRGAFQVDANGAPVRFGQREFAPLATQRVTLADLGATPPPSGWSYLNLQHSKLPGSEVGGQAWVARVMTFEGRFATLETGTPFDSSCTGPAFDNTSSGPAALLPPY